MKKRNLLLSVFISCFAIGFAQEDITPSRYVFANLPEGPYVIDATNAGANPPAAWAIVEEGFADGFVVLAGAPPHITGKDAPQVVGFQEGLTVVDLGGEVGKVLCVQGADSKYNVGTPMGTGYAGAWCNLNFYFDKNKTPTVAEFKAQGMSEDEAKEAAKVRVRMVFSVAENEISSEESILGKFYTSNFQNNVSPALTEVPDKYPGDYFQATDEEGDPIPNEEGEAFYDSSKWMIHEMDITIPEASGNPTRLKVELLGGRIAGGTLLIKEIKFTKNPTGAPVDRRMVSYKPGENTSIEYVKEKGKLQVGVIGNRVTVYNLEGKNTLFVYNITGQQTASFVNEGNQFSFSVSPGIYILKAGEKAAKIVVN